ncbi:MAG: GtrA family protein [Paludibacter sp.]|nr:GtrA family protein [Bacteroidales bacterium]MCM1069550.1 GtrA family protein [Prevotella sp.]MCM1354196.1 GtrA family protein [Bacteroides sp.]MCM1443065.1 GtrA family protein [Muribaculum sp.]MCM1482270.1 GtrA family protein [Paludibacter sp.]
MKEWIRFCKFALVSASAGLIELGSFSLLNEFSGWRYWPCYLTALLLSVLWNFTVNRQFTFRSNANITRAMLLVLLYYAIFTPTSTWLGDWLAESRQWNAYLVTLINMLLNFLTEFVFQRYVVYGKATDNRIKASTTKDTLHKETL